MAWYDFFATDPSFRNADEAQDRYLTQIGTISAAKGWPSAVRDRLLEFPWTDVDLEDAQSVYLHAWANEPIVIVSEGYDPAELANYEKHRNALVELAEASGVTRDNLEAASISSQISGGVKATAEDLQSGAEKAAEALDPKKSPWPWIIGGGVFLFILKELDVGGLIKGRR